VRACQEGVGGHSHSGILCIASPKKYVENHARTNMLSLLRNIIRKMYLVLGSHIGTIMITHKCVLQDRKRRTNHELCLQICSRNSTQVESDELITTVFQMIAAF